MITFTPLADFEAPEFSSVYCVGLSYTVREGNEKLARAVEKWLAEGKVRLGAAAGRAPGEASVQGKGEVQSIGAADVGTVDAAALIGKQATPKRK